MGESIENSSVAADSFLAWLNQTVYWFVTSDIAVVSAEDISHSLSLQITLKKTFLVSYNIR